MADGLTTFMQGQIVFVGWGNTLGIASLATSMAVNALVTGMIVFKILKVFLEVNPILVKPTLGSTGGATSKLQHIIFAIIESGMMLFTIQVIRLVFGILPMEWTLDFSEYAIAVNQMFNVNIRSIHF